jgi:hypothetical protein
VSANQPWPESVKVPPILERLSTVIRLSHDAAYGCKALQGGTFAAVRAGRRWLGPERGPLALTHIRDHCGRIRQEVDALEAQIGEVEL